MFGDTEEGVSDRKPLSRNEPRHLDDNTWYYVNAGSVDLVAREPNVYTATRRLKRRTLELMLAELRPLRRVARRKA